MTASQSNRPNGMRHWPEKLKRAKRLALTLSALLVLSLPTAACFEATRSTVTGTGSSNASVKQSAQKARCSSWRPLEYDAENDTLDTIHGIRIHNATGVNKKCWTK